MDVSYCGWTLEHGAFSCNVFIDENKTDYELHYRSGKIAYQKGPFQTVTADWNHDDDCYSLFGAWFETQNEDGSFSSGQFWTPTDMVRALVDNADPEQRSYGDVVVSIPGIEIPSPQNRKSLDHQIQQSETRALHQEIERNQKMSALGIRPSNEPWAR